MEVSEEEEEEARSRETQASLSGKALEDKKSKRPAHPTAVTGRICVPSKL
jgi:hypothetical protein